VPSSAEINKSNTKFKLLIVGAFVVIIAGIALVSLFATRSKVPVAAAGEAFPIRVAESATTPTTFEIASRLAGVDIPKKFGFQEVPVTIQGGEGGTVTMQAMLANQIDSSGGSISIWVNAVSQGAAVKLVGVTNTNQDPEYSGMLVLADSDIQTIKDLVNKKIAINTLGAEAEFVMRTFLAQNGLTWDQVQPVVLAAAQQEQALRSKQVDAALWTSSGGIEFDRAVDNGGVRRIPGTSSQEARGKKMVNTAIGFRQDFIDKHPDIVRAYVAASDAAIRLIWKAYQEDPQRVQQVYADISKEKGGNPDLAKYYRKPRWDPGNEVLHDDDIQFWISHLEESGKLAKGKVKPADVYTNDYFPKAPTVLELKK
jgi:ABC-type nitrate/sulfonate/bicarbonate transport system substrate-binding protein